MIGPDFVDGAYLIGSVIAIVVVAALVIALWR